MNYFETYQEVKELIPTNFRTHIRNKTLDVLSLIDKIKGLDNDFNKPRVQFILIHHIFKDEEKNFDNIMKILSRNHTFISYSEAVNLILSSKIDKPYICITSDDGIKNNLLAANILNKYGAKGCFFVNPDIVELKSFDDIANHCRTRIDFQPVQFLNWKDIEQLQKDGHEIGSHTMQHMDIGQANKQQIKEDCLKSFEVLTAKCGEAKHFAFPYGRFKNFSEMGRKEVFEAGYISCASAERGCHVNHDTPLVFDQLFLRRDPVIMYWKIEHILYFLAKSSRNASIQDNLYPY